MRAPLPSLLVVILALAACSDPEPAAVACPEPVEITFEGPEETALDILLVASVSPTMCEEQLALEQNLGLLGGWLQAASVYMDLHVAVTRTDLGCPDAPAALGRLNRTAAKALPAECGFRSILACTQDSDCDVPGEEGVWRCERPADDACITSTNGSIDARCRRTCDSDLECQDHFGDPAAVCRNPGEPSWSICSDHPRLQTAPRRPAPS